MSQAKVDRYKEEKANRKQTMKKQRMMDAIRKCVLAVAGLAIVVWLGLSAYSTIELNKEREIASVNYDAVNAYIDGLAEE